MNFIIASWFAICDTFTAIKETITHGSFNKTQPKLQWWVSYLMNTWTFNIKKMIFWNDGNLKFQWSLHIAANIASFRPIHVSLRQVCLAKCHFINNKVEQDKTIGLYDPCNHLQHINLNSTLISLKMANYIQEKKETMGERLASAMHYLCFMIVKTFSLWFW